MYTEECTEKPSANNKPAMSIIFVRLVGIGIMLFGVSMLIDAVDAAWNLFNSPEYLANLAEMIDAQSGLNSFFERAYSDLTQVNSDLQSNLSGAGNSSLNVPRLNISYFAALLIVFTVISIVGKIAYWALAEGGKLACFKLESDALAKNCLGSFAK